MNPLTAPSQASHQAWRPQRSGVTAYVNRRIGAAWLDVTGPLSPPTDMRRILSQLRRAHRRIPEGIDVVGVDLTRLDELTIEVAVLLCVESQMLGIRGIRLGVVLRNETALPTGAQQMLERLQIWRVADDRLAQVANAAAEARQGRHGWRPLVRQHAAAPIAS